MNIRIGFGLLLLSVSEKLMKLSGILIPLDTGTESKTETTSVKIWGVLDGPYCRNDFPEEELYDLDIDPDMDYMLVCKVEEDGKIGVMNLWYYTLDEALKVKYYFDQHIEPLELKF